MSDSVPPGTVARAPVRPPQFIPPTVPAGTMTTQKMVTYILGLMLTFIGSNQGIEFAKQYFGGNTAATRALIEEKGEELDAKRAADVAALTASIAALEGKIEATDKSIETINVNMAVMAERSQQQAKDTTEIKQYLASQPPGRGKTRYPPPE